MENEPLEGNVEPVKLVLPEKKKKVLSEKQLEALARGRQKGLEKIKTKGQITRQVKEAEQEVKKIKEVEKVESVEELKNITDLHFLRKKMEEMDTKFNNIDNGFKSVESKFNGYLSERAERKKIKDENLVQKTIKQEMPRAMNDMMLKKKLEEEMKSNPFYGRI